MKPLTLIAASLLTLGLAACGGAENTESATEMTHQDNADHSGHDMGDMKEGVGHATGTIKSVSSQGDTVTIAHGPFEGDIGMDAMTMGFGIMGEVVLSSFAEGDEVAFMVKHGRDGTYRIMAICNTDTDGADCLDGMMDH